ncbi:MAG: hypothetical protein KF788_02210 [Piscinibacter sp.]|nr:hypothetical protein [Piscinibacter sp.]
MSLSSTPRLCAALLLLASAGAWAEPWFERDDLQRNGHVSRHLWQPEGATAEIAGLRVSAGLAIGLRGAVHSNLGRRYTPALMVDLGQRSSLSLLPGNDGAMLVWQTAP